MCVVSQRALARNEKSPSSALFACFTTCWNSLPIGGNGHFVMSWRELIPLPGQSQRKWRPSFQLRPNIFLLLQIVNWGRNMLFWGDLYTKKQIIQFYFFLQTFKFLESTCNLEWNSQKQRKYHLSPWNGEIVIPSPVLRSAGRIWFRVKDHSDPHGSL